jgi:serine/threonine protein kinase
LTVRDERWVNRFPFAWNDTLFYDPLEVYYRPRRDHFLSGLAEEQRSRFVRSGIWWSYRNNPALPSQGWKIHVSVDRHSVRETAGTVLGYLLEHDIDCKIALDINIYEMLNSKAMSRGGSGKFITIYPRDEDEFRACISDLAELLGNAAGPYVLSDMRYRDSGALYFRYGQFLDTHAVDAMGRKVPHILGPDGPISDERRPEFVQPWWRPWPFSDWKPDAEADADGGLGLLGGRFRVTEAIQFSNTGGVYVAEDTADDDQTVVLKEARPHTNPNPRLDYDAVDILAREWSFLNRLADSGRCPAPVAKFRHWEHHFIAEEHVDGVDIRSIMFEHNPLLQPRFDPVQSREYLRLFLAVSRGLTHGIQALHARQVIMGDLTATNLLVNPDTFEVTLIDLESCRLAESDEPDRHLQGSVELYTQGFSHSRREGGVSTLEGDLYSLAAIMAYIMFPVAAMSYLRDDVFDVFRLYLDRLGWPLRIHELIKDLSQARISISEALTALEREAELADSVEIVARPVAAAKPSEVTELEAGVAAFMTAVADPERASLFPVDPFAHITNPLSLGFGASGVLWALHASGVAVRPEWRQWLRDQIADIEVEEYPVGLMSGLAGIAWAADSLGLRTEARHLLSLANERPTRQDDYTFYYGSAGLGITNLYFYLRDGAEGHLAAAQECARALCETVQYEGPRAYWLNEFATDGPLTGLGFGQAGVALFLLRMHQVTGNQSYLRLGRDALRWEMDNAEPWGEDSVIFKHEATLFPYVEVGSAGVAQVLLRYSDLDAARTVLRGLTVDCAAMPGYAFGMSGIADAMLDAAAILGEPSYRDRALQQIGYVRDVFLFEPPERFAVPSRDGITPLAVPGEGLLRCSCDVMTGSAGILRVLHRVNAGGMADFLLDEVRP